MKNSKIWEGDFFPSQNSSTVKDLAIINNNFKKIPLNIWVRGWGKDGSAGKDTCCPAR